MKHEQKDSDKGIRQRLQQLALNNLNDMVIITKALKGEPLNSSIVFVNKAFEEVIRRTPTFLHGPEISEEILARINKKIKRHESLREEFINYRKDGTPYWAELDINTDNNGTCFMLKFEIESEF